MISRKTEQRPAANSSNVKELDPQIPGGAPGFFLCDLPNSGMIGIDAEKIEDVLDEL
jgi:hypothetical protein